MAHLLLPASNLRNKFYYKLFLRITGSYRITTKWCTNIRFLDFNTFRDESYVDRLGIDLLRNAGMDTGYVKEMLTNLLNSGNMNKREKMIARMRLLKIYFHSFS